MAQVLTSELTLTVSRTIPARPARVYDAWLNPAVLARFMVPCDGWGQARVANDPRVGGTFNILMIGDGKEVPHHGTYLELAPHTRLRFTWESPHSVEGSMVTITLTPEGEGTRIDLRQDRFATEQAVEGHRSGWTAILEQLAAVA